MSEESVARLRELLKRAGIGDVSPRVLLGLGAVVVVIVAAVLLRWSPDGEEFSIGSRVVADAAGEADAATGATGSGAGQASASGEPASAEPTSVVVHVVGAVRHPGVVSLSAGSRVNDAITATGGLLPNAAQESLNLAGVLADGQQVLVLTADEWVESGATVARPAPAGQAGAATPAGGALVNINAATAPELEALPGVGPSTAAKIVQDRETNGPFDSPEDLMRVSGIGPKKFEALKDAVTVR